MSIVLLDTMQQKIRFPEINEELKISDEENNKIKDKDEIINENDNINNAEKII